jgi:hypothetical protein
MSAKPIAGDTPYIEPGDENSKFYTKPDVPPIPHPADLIDDLKKEFPDMEMPELVKLADERVSAEIARRKAEAPLAPPPPSHTPWEALYRAHVGSLEGGAVLEFAVDFQKVGARLPRHNH